jgi:hypothetical protein
VLLDLGVQLSYAHQQEGRGTYAPALALFAEALWISSLEPHTLCRTPSTEWTRCQKDGAIFKKTLDQAVGCMRWLGSRTNLNPTAPETNPSPS